MSITCYCKSEPIIRIHIKAEEFYKYQMKFKNAMYIYKVNYFSCLLYYA